MPDMIPAADRELIAQALAAGRVTICPPVTFKPVPQSFNIPADYPKPVPGSRAVRRARVQELANGCRSVAEMAEILGVDPKLVEVDVSEMRRAGVDVRMPGRGMVRGEIKSWGWQR